MQTPGRGGNVLVRKLHVGSTSSAHQSALVTVSRVSAPSALFLLVTLVAA